MKERKDVTKITPVRDPKRVGVKGRQVRINWEGKISFGGGLVDEIELEEGWSMKIHENKEESIPYLVYYVLEKHFTTTRHICCILICGITIDHSRFLSLNHLQNNPSQ